MQIRQFKYQNLNQRQRMIMFGFVFGVIGLAFVLVSNAATTSTISGVVFKDTNRNGIMDSGEEPMAGQSIYLLDGIGQNYISSVGTDSTGRYTFSGLNDGNYQIEYGPQDWWAIRAYWVPTTTGSIFPKKNITLSGQANFNFGWRQIVRSYDPNSPTTSYVAPNGLKINSYDDAVSASDIYNALSQASLLGKEASLTTIWFDYPVEPNSTTGIRDYENNQPNFTSVSVSGGQGNWNNYTANIRLSYLSWTQEANNVLFHEYGHAWSLYYAYIERQDTNLTEYLKLRGIENDTRLDTNHAWNRRELIAEDYRQLFGSLNAQQVGQENYELPPAKDVPGLKEYLSGAFMQTATPPTSDTQEPSAPTGLTGNATAGSEGGYVNLNWAASSDNVGVVKYYIYRNNTQVGYVNSPSTSFYDNGLTVGTGYQYYVKAVDAAGNQSAASNTITVTPQVTDTQAPSQPSGLISPSQTNNSISLKWNPSNDNVGVVGYRIYQIGGSRKNTFNTLLTTTNGVGTTHTVSGLARGTSYSFYVVAIDAAGNASSPSSTLVVKTKR